MAVPTAFDLEAGDRERAARKAAKVAAKAATAQEDGGATAKQLTRDDLQNMTAEQIVAAHDAGELNGAIGWASEDVKVVDRARAGEKLSRADIEVLARLEQHQLIIQAYEAGNIEATSKPAATADTETED